VNFGGYTLSFFLITISIYKVSKASFTYRYKGLASRVASLEVLIIMLYTIYANSTALYMFSLYFLKCVECIHRDVAYDRNFSKKDFNRLEVKKRKLKIAL
jgi:hypothetical protein